MFKNDDYKNVGLQLVVGTVLIVVALVVPAIRDWLLKDVTLPRLTVILPALLGVGLIVHLWFRVKRLKAALSVAQIAASHPTVLAPLQEWESYTQDRILRIEWEWRWHGTSIEALTPLCPECGMELGENKRPFDDSGMMPGEWLDSVECHNMDCKWFRHFGGEPHVDTPSELRDLVKKHIRLKARGLGLRP